MSERNGIERHIADDLRAENERLREELAEYRAMVGFIGVDMTKRDDKFWQDFEKWKREHE